MSETRINDTKPGRIAPESPYWNRLFEVQRLTGYHPHAAFEAAQDSVKFDHWFALLPDDLTLVDLSPLYVLAADATQIDQVRRRERSWKPNPDNLGEEYNGPLGDDREPMPHNLRQWREAVEAKERSYRNRFNRDLNLMEGGDVPDSLKQAAHALFILAKSADKPNEDEPCEWDGCTGVGDVVATAAAVRLCLTALAEVDATARGIGRDVVGEVRSELKLIETLDIA